MKSLKRQAKKITFYLVKLGPDEKEDVLFGIFIFFPLFYFIYSYKSTSFVYFIM